MDEKNAIKKKWCYYIMNSGIVILYCIFHLANSVRIFMRDVWKMYNEKFHGNHFPIENWYLQGTDLEKLQILIFNKVEMYNSVLHVVYKKILELN